MTEDEFECILFYLEYIQATHGPYVSESLRDDPEEYKRYLTAKEMLRKCNSKKRNVSVESSQETHEEKQTQPDLSAALPQPLQLPIEKQALLTTMFTPLPCIVSEGYQRDYTGINWPHYENMLKLFALDYFIHGVATLQQQKDRMDLASAIETKGNARYKRKHLTADEIIERASRLHVYIPYGKNVIRAMAEKDPITSERRLKDLRAEIPDTRNDYNAIQLHKMMSKARTIFMILQSRYRGRE